MQEATPYLRASATSSLNKYEENGGETGIRTLGTITSTTVFETAPFDHSGISPHVLAGLGLASKKPAPCDRAGPLTHVFTFAKPANLIFLR